MNISKQYLESLEYQAKELIEQTNKVIEYNNFNYVEEKIVYKSFQKQLRSFRELLNHELELAIDQEAHPYLYDISNSTTIRLINTLRVENNKDF